MPYSKLRSKYQRMIFEGIHQNHTKLLWEIFKEIMDQNIFKELYVLDSDETQQQYLENLESLFIEKARSYKIPKHIITTSKTIEVLYLLTRKYDLTPSKVRLTITQLKECARKKCR